MRQLLSLTRRRFVVGASCALASSCAGLAPPPRPAMTFVPSPNFGLRDGATVDTVVMHYTQSSLGDAVRHFMDPQSEVSAHFLIGRDGTVIQMVDELAKAWHAKRIMNPRSIGIEHEAAPHQAMSLEQEQASVALLRWLMFRFPAITPARIAGHRFTPLNEGTTDCPSGLFGDETKEALDAWVGRHFGWV